MQRIVNLVLLAVLACMYVLPVGIAHSEDRSLADEITFTLVDASTDQNLFTLVDEATINLAETGKELNIRADIGIPVNHVRFELDGTDFRTEKKVPYALAGDNTGDYKSWTPTVGHYTLQATAYDTLDIEIARNIIYFTVINNTIDVNSPIRSWPRKNYSTKPENLRDTKVEPTEIHISWDHPGELLRNHQSCIAGYKIYLDGEHVDTIYADSDYRPPSYTSAVLTGLVPGEIYKIRVRTIVRVSWDKKVGFWGDGESIRISLKTPTGEGGWIDDQISGCPFHPCL